MAAHPGPVRDGGRGADGADVRAEVWVRDAGPDDAQAIARIRVAGWRSAYAGLLDQSVLDASDPVAEADRRRADLTAGLSAGTALRVAGRAGCVVGFALSGPYRASGDDPAGSTGPDDAELRALYVDPPAWSAGVGSVLVEDAAALLAAAGHPVVRLWVLAGNTRARRFYARHRFVDEGVGADYTPRGGTRAAPELRYRRDLP